jgi:glutathione S-transferase
MPLPKLYTWRGSGNSYKIRLLAALRDIKVDLVEIDFLNNQQRSPEFLAINPRGTIPVLVDGEKTFTDSAAILVYLAGLASDSGTTKTLSSFWASETVEQAAIVDWLAFASSWLESGLITARFIVSFNYRGVSSPAYKQALARATAQGHKSLKVLQARLSANEWVALGRPTIADVAIFAYVATAAEGDISLDPYPAVKSWISRIRNLPGFIAIDGLDDPTYWRRHWTKL